VEQLSTFRAELAARVRDTEQTKTARPEAILEGKNHFPLFEGNPGGYVGYLENAKSLEPFRQSHSVAAAARWLKRRGIDVIFVPVPKMTEVYPEYFADHCPADHIVAPHLRHILEELLDEDVEVVDLLPAFLQERDTAPEPLYQPADPHWSARAQEIGARAIAERLKRYDFVAKALASPPLFKTIDIPYAQGSGRAALPFMSPEQKERALAAEPKTWPTVAHRNGGSLLSEESPVVFIGDSYNCGLWERVGREINLPIHLLYRSGSTTEVFKDFVRDPDMLKDCKVVVWVVCNSGLQFSWSLPAPVLKVSETP
jgi:hypothetical protein